MYKREREDAECKGTTNNEKECLNRYAKKYDEETRAEGEKLQALSAEMGRK